MKTIGAQSVRRCNNQDRLISRAIRTAYEADGRFPARRWTLKDHCANAESVTLMKMRTSVMGAI
jgi:hypothetical protein